MPGVGRAQNINYRLCHRGRVVKIAEHKKKPNHTNNNNQQTTTIFTIDDHGIIETDSRVTLPRRRDRSTTAGTDRDSQSPDLECEIKRVHGIEGGASLVTAPKDDHRVEPWQLTHCVVHQCRPIGN